MKPWGISWCTYGGDCDIFCGDGVEAIVLHLSNDPVDGILQVGGTGNARTKAVAQIGEAFKAHVILQSQVEDLIYLILVGSDVIGGAVRDKNTQEQQKGETTHLRQEKNFDYSAPHNIDDPSGIGHK